MALNFPNNDPNSSARQIKPTVQVANIDELPQIIEDKAHQMGIVFKVNNTPPDAQGNVTVDASEIEIVIDGTDVILQEVFNRFGDEFIDKITIKQDPGQPVQLVVDTRYVNGSTPISEATNLVASGKLNISYVPGSKTILFNDTACKVFAVNMEGPLGAYPEPMSTFVNAVSVPIAGLAVNDLLMLLDYSTSKPVIFGQVTSVDVGSVTLTVIASAFPYSSVVIRNTYAEIAALPNPQSRFLYITLDDDKIYAYIDGTFTLLNDGGIITGTWPFAGHTMSAQYLYVDIENANIYAWKPGAPGSLVLMNPGAIIAVDTIVASLNPRYLYRRNADSALFGYTGITSADPTGFSRLNDGGVLVVPTLPLIAQADSHFVYVTSDTHNAYVFDGTQYIMLNDGGVIVAKPATGDPRFLYVDGGDIFAWVTGKGYVLLNEGGIIGINTVVALHALTNPNPRMLYQITGDNADKGDVYANVNGTWKLLNDGGIITVDNYVALQSITNPDLRSLYRTADTEQIYARIKGMWYVLDDGGVKQYDDFAAINNIPMVNRDPKSLYVAKDTAKGYLWINNTWHIINKEGGLYVGVFARSSDLPTDRGELGDWALVELDETTVDNVRKIAFWTVIDVSTTGVRTWGSAISLMNIIGPKFIGYFYTESALISAITNQPATFNVGDFGILINNNQTNPTVPVLHEPPTAANTAHIYIIKTINPTITFDNQVYINSEGTYKGAVATPTDLPQTIANNEKKGDWMIVRNNGINRSAIYVIEGINVLVPSITWASSFIFPQIDVVDDLVTQDATKALSANQGYVLDQKIQSLETDIHVRGTVLNTFTPQGNYDAVATAVPRPFAYWIIDDMQPVSVVSLGSDYVVDDVLTIETGDAIPPQIKVTTVNETGGITAFSWTNGYGSSDFSGTVTPTGGTGTLATFSLICKETDAAYGWGYSVGEALILSNGDAKLDAIAVIDAVDGSGGITGLSVSKGGIFTAAPTEFIAPKGGNGYGLILDVTTTNEANSTLYSIVDPKQNDVAIILADEIHGGNAWQWIFADYNGDGVYNWVPLAPYATGSSRDFYANPITTPEIADHSISAAKVNFSITPQFTYIVQDTATLDAWCDATPGNDYTHVGIINTLSIEATNGKYVLTSKCNTVTITGIPNRFSTDEANRICFMNAPYAIYDDIGSIQSIKDVAIQVQIKVPNMPLPPIEIGSRHFLAVLRNIGPNKDMYTRFGPNIPGGSNGAIIENCHIYFLKRPQSTGTNYYSKCNIYGVFYDYYELYGSTVTARTSATAILNNVKVSCMDQEPTTANRAFFIGFEFCKNLTNCNFSLYAHENNWGRCYLTGFNKCRHLTKCLVYLEEPKAISFGFDGCGDLLSCEMRTDELSGDQSDANGEYFVRCSNLTNCIVNTNRTTTKTRGLFNTCSILHNCRGIFTVDVGTTSTYCFCNCYQLYNCIGVITSGTTHVCYINCYQLLMCHALVTSTSSGVVGQFSGCTTPEGNALANNAAGGYASAFSRSYGNSESSVWSSIKNTGRYSLMQYWD